MVLAGTGKVRWIGLLIMLFPAFLVSQSKYCYDKTRISLPSGQDTISFKLSNLDSSSILKVSIKPLLSRTGYLVCDEKNNILQVFKKNFISIGALTPGVYRIWGFLYIGSLTAEPGADATNSRLGSFCYSLTQNFIQLTIIGEETEALFSIEILHHGNGNSKLNGIGNDFPAIGGVDRFKAVVDSIRVRSVTDGRPPILVGTGDLIQAGVEFSANQRLNPSDPFYEARAAAALGYDLAGLGNQDFDFGPDLLAKLIFDAPGPFIASNLDFSQSPSLQPLYDSRKLSSSIVVWRDSQQIGFVHLVEPNLKRLSNPGQVEVKPDWIEAAQQEIDQLQASGVNKLVLITHFEHFDAEKEILAQLDGVDVLIAGGSEAFLSNVPDTDAIPGFADADQVQGNYPLLAKDRTGRNVYVVAVPGSYAYLGRLVVAFDKNGEIVKIDPASGPVKIDAPVVDPALKMSVVDPLNNYVNSLASNRIGATQVELDGRAESVRAFETNAGNLIADALFWQADFFAPIFGIEKPDIAIEYAGAIQNSVVIPARRPITELNTFQMLPGADFVVVTEKINPGRLKQILEHAFSGDPTDFGDQFLQISGFKLVYDPNGMARQVDANGNVLVEGSRIVRVVLQDGTVLIDNGNVLEGAPGVSVATSNLILQGKLEFPFDGISFSNLTVTHQQALANYIVFALSGSIFEAKYPEGGEGRIMKVQDNGIMAPVPFPATEINGTKNINTSVFPNPVENSFAISYVSEQDTQTEITLFDRNGRAIRRLFSGRDGGGFVQHQFDRKTIGIPSGIFVLVIKHGHVLVAQKLVFR